MSLKKSNFVLYHDASSICSIMVRYSYALRGDPDCEEARIDLREQTVDIFHEAQLSEKYLCEINPFGEVPVLAALPLHPKDTIPDSLAITLFLAKHYPSLMPAAHFETISKLLRDLHNINYYSLTFTERPETVHTIQDAIKLRLQGNINQAYRDALEYKLAHMEESRVHALDSEQVEHNRELALGLMEKLGPHLEKSTSGWLFGLDAPSALDAHIVVFLARMSDIGRNNLVPNHFREYLARAKQGKAWREVQQGSTKPPMR